MSKTFAENLAERMKTKGLTQAQLARKIWGSIKDQHGHDVARNRDRISQWLKGKGHPMPDNLKKLAETLDCAQTDLMEDVAPPLTRAKRANVAMITSTNQPGRMLLQAPYVVLDTTTALKVMELIGKGQLED